MARVMCAAQAANQAEKAFEYWMDRAHACSDPTCSDPTCSCWSSAAGDVHVRKGAGDYSGTFGKVNAWTRRYNRAIVDSANDSQLPNDLRRRLAGVLLSRSESAGISDTT